MIPKNEDKKKTNKKIYSILRKTMIILINYLKFYSVKFIYKYLILTYY